MCEDTLLWSPPASLISNCQEPRMVQGAVGSACGCPAQRHSSWALTSELLSGEGTGPGPQASTKHSQDGQSLWGRGHHGRGQSDKRSCWAVRATEMWTQQRKPRPGHGLTQMSCFSQMGRLEYRSTTSGALYMGVVFLVIWARIRQHWLSGPGATHRGGPLPPVHGCPGPAGWPVLGGGCRQSDGAKRNFPRPGGLRGPWAEQLARAPPPGRLVPN